MKEELEENRKMQSKLQRDYKKYLKRIFVCFGLGVATAFTAAFFARVIPFVCLAGGLVTGVYNSIRAIDAKDDLNDLKVEEEGLIEAIKLEEEKSKQKVNTKIKTARKTKENTNTYRKVESINEEETKRRAR